jgi:hypothetical protein
MAGRAIHRKAMPVKGASHPINFLSKSELREFLHPAKVVVHSLKIAVWI